jgi:hypothetical protein
MAARRPRTDDELRALGVPDDVIRHRHSKHRVHVGPLVGVKVEGPEHQAVPPSDEVLREEMGRKIHEARRRFRPREH